MTGSRDEPQTLQHLSLARRKPGSGSQNLVEELAMGKDHRNGWAGAARNVVDKASRSAAVTHVDAGKLPFCSGSSQ
jgi:hypothetical protein